MANCTPMVVQLCIVTGQPLANLIPILQENPARVALAVSEGMTAEADSFEQTLAMAGWADELVDRFEGLPATGYDGIFLRALEIEEALIARHPGCSIVYNATGGNKLMAMAFGSVFGAGTEKRRVIYVDTPGRSIEVLHPRSEPPVPMASVLNLELYLKAEGKTVRSRQDSDPVWREAADIRKPATRFLANNADQLGWLVSQFNRQLGPFHGSGDSPSALRLEGRPRGLALRALERLVETGVLAPGKDHSEWRLGAPDAMKYLSGAWLEEYVWLVARDCGVDEVALSLTMTDDFARKADLRNEIDVAVVHANQLLLIECKTGNLARDGKDQDTVYKLDSLADQAGGILGAGLLVSFQPLERTTRVGRKVNIRARAGSVALYTCEAEQLSNLKHSIQHWMQTGKWEVV